MRALIYTNSEQEYQLLRKIAEEEIDGIIVSQVRMDGHFHVEEDSDIAVIALCVQRSWTTLAGVSPVTVIASEPCS